MKDNKKIKDVIHVDLSIIGRKSEHEGLRNTAVMKNIFEEYEDLKVVCLVFKELLSVHNLNKPFTGGISSYILVIMAHNIMKMRKKQINGDYASFVDEFCEFIT